MQKTAFLFGKLKDQVFMEKPEGYAVADLENHVCLLEKIFKAWNKPLEYGMRSSTCCLPSSDFQDVNPIPACIKDEEVTHRRYLCRRWYCLWIHPMCCKTISSAFFQWNLIYAAYQQQFPFDIHRDQE